MSQTMQQDARAAASAVAGNTARALSVPAPQEVRERRRTPLSLVPAGPTRGRVPFAVFSMAALVTALVVVLMLNISVSSSQYKLVSMRGEEVALAEQNQALTQELENLRAPQNLAVAARDLDMVTSPTFGTIDVDSQSVTGSPEPAKGSEAPEILVPVPAVSLPNGSGASSGPDAAPDAPAPEAETPSTDAPAAADPEPSAGQPDEGGAAQAAEPEGGGTIPAPQQSAPGQ